MKKSLLILTLALFCLAGAKSQSIDEIKASGKYLIGKGFDYNAKKADVSALDELVSQISTNVESNFEYWFENTETDFKENCQAMVRTYSNITLTQATKIESETDDGFLVYRYILKDEVRKLFEARAQKIESYTRMAIEAEEEFRIGDALRYYYWAFILLKSHPEGNSLEFAYDDKGKFVFEVFLHDRLNRVFSLLDVTVNSAVEKTGKILVPMNITFNGKKVRNLDYKYWSGDRWTKSVGISNGTGVLEFFDKATKIPSEIRLRFEYKYMTKCALDKDIEAVASSIRLPKLEKSEMLLALHSDKIIGATAQEEKEKNTAKPKKGKRKSNSEHQISDLNNNDKVLIGQSESVVKSALEFTEEQQYEKAKPLFTAEGFEIYQQLLQYGEATILPFEELASAKTSRGTLFRSVPVKFNFPNNNRSFIEHLCFTVDSTNRISEIKFSLGEHAANGIMKHERWPEATRWEIINFLEDYKTAYALERVEYIKDIFADNALIIVGRKIQKAEPIEGMYKSLGNDQFEYVQKSKKEYIESLESVFASNGFVNIQFTESTVKKRDRDSEVYGIQIEQDYFSTNYGDHGYLFLMVDMNKTAQPKIYVRSWQPEKNPDGTIMGLNHFRF